MSTMKDLARIVSDRHDIPVNEAEQFLNDMFNLLKEGLSIDEQVKIKGLGTFKVMTIQERKSVNVNTGQTIIIDSHDRISFTPDGSMKESVNKPFAHFETVPINDGVVFDDIEDIAEQTRAHIVVSDNMQNAQDSQPAPIAVSEHEQPVTAVAAEPIMQHADEQSPEHEAKVVTEPVTEAVNEPETEPVIEPVAETVNEPVAEHTVEPVAETVNETQTASEPTLETSREPVNEPVPITIIEPVDDPVTETNSVNRQSENVELEQDKIYSNPTDNTMDYLNPSKNDNSISVNTALFISVIVLIIGIVIGRFTADMTYDSIKEKFFQTEQTVVQDEVEFTAIDESELANEAEQKTHNTAEKIDSARKIAAAEAEARREQALKKAQEQVQAKKEAEEKQAEQNKKAAEAKAAATKPAASATNSAAANYDSDPRIRYGAYRIVGVQNTVTVKAGQTLQSISKAYLGPGMECYVEAINGTKVVKEGQTIKIPQLQIKKKKKAE